MQRGRTELWQTDASAVFGTPYDTLDFINSRGQDSTVNHVLSTTGNTLAISNQAFNGKYWVRLYTRQKDTPGTQ